MYEAPVISCHSAYLPYSTLYYPLELLARSYDPRRGNSVSAQVDSAFLLFAWHCCCFSTLFYCCSSCFSLPPSAWTLRYSIPLSRHQAARARIPCPCRDPSCHSSQHSRKLSHQ